MTNTRTPPPPSLHREPIEADREAAAEVFAKQFGKEAGGVFAIRTGERDDHYLVQSFMRHRLAFSTPAASDAEAMLRELHVAMAGVMELRRLSSTAWEQTKAHAAITAWRKAETFLATLPLPKAGEGEA